MKNARKFEFGLSFDPPNARGAARAAATPAPAPEILPEPEPEAPPPPPAPTFGQEELDAARHLGLMEGRTIGETDAMQRIERRLADTVERLAHDLENLGEAQQAALGRIERQATALAVDVVRKLFPAFVARSGTVEIAALIADALSLAMEQPKLTLRCAPDMIGALEPILTQTAARSGFEGRLAVRGDPELSETDCRIEWNEGGLDRESGRLMTEIESAVARGLEDFDRRFGSDGAGNSGALEEVRP
ncbi:MAG TPA: FliH/SctL family protein [Aliidongia sp.]|uniref:FliH/SctL family protein n=1 Tax=Aliidongia sp. TaxID=1914230 RepID=UPI002DDDA98B|nr:FliH/SctL family protein [Aliidongia sp.]HEV2674059.1 FliH/SctL family protein [Aliidongia sp.]